MKMLTEPLTAAERAAIRDERKLWDDMERRIADLESLLHDCDAMLEKVLPHFGGDEADAIGRLQQRIINAVST